VYNDNFGFTVPFVGRGVSLDISKVMVGRVIPSITQLELSNRWIY